MTGVSHLKDDDARQVEYGRADEMVRRFPKPVHATVCEIDAEEGEGDIFGEEPECAFNAMTIIIRPYHVLVDGWRRLIWWGIGLFPIGYVVAFVWTESKVDASNGEFGKTHDDWLLILNPIEKRQDAISPRTKRKGECFADANRARFL